MAASSCLHFTEVAGQVCASLLVRLRGGSLVFVFYAATGCRIVVMCVPWAMRNYEASPQALGIGALLRLFSSHLAARLHPAPVAISVT